MLRRQFFNCCEIRPVVVTIKQNFIYVIVYIVIIVLDSFLKQGVGSKCDIRFLASVAKRLKKCSFLKRKSLLDLYFKVILLPVTYGIASWGNCNNMDYSKSLQALHCLAGRLIFNLPRDTPSEVVMELTQWNSIYDLYKLSLVKLFYNIVSDNMPSTVRMT